MSTPETKRHTRQSNMPREQQAANALHVPSTHTKTTSWLALRERLTG
jgi:hypothetical protein